MMKHWKIRPIFDGPFKSVHDKWSGQRGAKFPADQSPGTQIQFSSQVEPSVLLARDISNISTPHLIRPLGRLWERFQAIWIGAHDDPEALRLVPASVCKV